jgi:pilus assembly protein CpaD
VPGCPDYSRMSQPNFDQHTWSNLGCANNSNLAAMVANPVDLVHGNSAGSVTDPATGSRAIVAYRAAIPTGTGGTTIKSEKAGGK